MNPIVDSMGALYDYDDQPIPYFYIYFVCLLQTMYLPLVAILMAYQLSVVGIGFELLGVTVRSSSNDGISAADGTR